MMTNELSIDIGWIVMAAGIFFGLTTFAITSWIRRRIFPENDLDNVKWFCIFVRALFEVLIPAIMILALSVSAYAINELHIASAVYLGLFTYWVLTLLAIIYFDKFVLGRFFEHFIYAILSGVFVAAIDLATFVLFAIGMIGFMLATIGFHMMRSEPWMTEKLEGKLYSFEREYGHLFFSRYKQDYLLRSFFLAIMLKESSARPSWYKLFEWIMLKVRGKASTGIMQVTAKKFLSDEESIDRAQRIIEKIWNDFLRACLRDGKNRAKYYGGDSAECCTCKQVILKHVAGKYYAYDYARLGELLTLTIDELYAHYRGSSAISITHEFAVAQKFVQSQNYLTSEKIVLVRGSHLDKTSRDK